MLSDPSLRFGMTKNEEVLKIIESKKILINLTLIKMKKLYGSSGRIKVDLIEKALIDARREGKLSGVSTTDIGHFVRGFEEKMEEEEFRKKIGTQITQREVKELLKSLKLNKRDKISDSELDTISEILLDKKYIIG